MEPVTGTTPTTTTPNAGGATGAMESGGTAKISDLGPSASTLRKAASAKAPAKASQAVLLGQDITVTRGRAKDARAEGFVGYANMGNPPTELTKDFTHSKGTDNVEELLKSSSGKTASIGLELQGDGVAKSLAETWQQWEKASETEKSKGMLAFLRKVHGEHGFPAIGNLLELGRLIAENPKTNVELRPGYEFDGTWNNYMRDTYPDAFKLISSFISKDDKGLGLKNVDMVFQTAAYPVRKSVQDYDILNGADTRGMTLEQKQAAVTAHMDRWYPGDKYVDQIGMSMFRSDKSHMLYGQRDKVDEVGDGGTGEIETVIWDTVAKYAKDKGKKLQISELTPKGVYANIDRFNAKIDEWNANNPDKQLRHVTDGEVPVAITSIDAIPMDWFFDDSRPEAQIVTKKQHYDSHIKPMAEWIKSNSSNISSVNIITYNWDSYFGWSALQSKYGESVGPEDNWGLGMTDYQIDAFVAATNGKNIKDKPTGLLEPKKPEAKPTTTETTSSEEEAA